MFSSIEAKGHLVWPLVLLGIVIVLVGSPLVIINTPLKNDIEIAPLYGNKCIEKRDGAILEERPHSFILKYTMESEQFDIFCYNELIADMNNQNVSNIWITLYANDAIVRWNEKEYIFTRPNKNYVVTDSNVSTLLKEK